MHLPLLKNNMFFNRFWFSAEFYKGPKLSSSSFRGRPPNCFQISVCLRQIGHCSAALAPAAAAQPEGRIYALQAGDKVSW
jgi:hypothetical protein